MLRVERLSGPRAGAAAAAGGRRSGSTTSCSPTRPGSTRARCARRCARPSTPTSWSPTTTAATCSATRSCARSSTTTCCPASAPSCTWRSRARSSAAPDDDGGAPARRRRSRTTTPPPATSRRRWRRRSAPRGRRARARPRRGAGAARARAGAVGPRAGPRGARRRRPRQRCCARGRRRGGARRPRPPARAARGRAAELGPSRTRCAPRRCSSATARAQRQLNRARSSIATLERGLELVERATRRRAGRAALLAGLARARMLVAPLGDAVDAARKALERRRAAGMRLLEGHARNTLGCSLASTGDTDAGIEQLQRGGPHRARARRPVRPRRGPQQLRATCCTSLGRSGEARAAARRRPAGGGAGGGPWR